MFNAVINHQNSAAAVHICILRHDITNIKLLRNVKMFFYGRRNLLMLVQTNTNVAPRSSDLSRRMVDLY